VATGSDVVDWFPIPLDMNQRLNSLNAVRN
jgi:hypothetical protein